MAIPCRYTRATWNAAVDAEEMLDAAARADRRVLASCAIALVRRVLARFAYPSLARALDVTEAWVRHAATESDVRHAMRDVDAARTLHETEDTYIWGLARAVGYVAATALGDPADAVAYVAHHLSDEFSDLGMFPPTMMLRGVSLGLMRAARAEGGRWMAAVVRTHIPWSTLHAAYGAR